MRNRVPSLYYLRTRLKKITDARARGENPYPHKFHVDLSLPDYIDEYAHLKNDELLNDSTVRIAGRVMAKRESSSKLHFYDARAAGRSLQLVANARYHGQKMGDTMRLHEVHKRTRRGDVVGVTGYPTRTTSGELSLMVTDMQILAPCLHPLPQTHAVLNDLLIRYRQRYLDLMYNQSTYDKFVTRARIISFIRRYLDALGFLEIETPILNAVACGANARAFRTRFDDTKVDMFLRTAPEIFHKMCIVGGIERVFEIGRQFRNEGIDPMHSPEFTTCEFYMAYADYNDLMTLTEDMLHKMVINVLGCTSVTFHPRVKGCEKPKPLIADFTPPFRRIDMYEELQRLMPTVKMPSPDILHTEEAREVLDGACVEYGVQCSQPRTSARLIEKLCKVLIEPQCIAPTFVVNHPIVMSPLAKAHRYRRGLSERFELFVFGKELCNAYTELNDPVVQRERFEQQEKERAQGDDEAQLRDEEFCTALEYGMPPTAGWGMGIDRIVMFLTDSNNIKEVIMFPLPARRRSTEEDKVERE